MSRIKLLLNVVSDLRSLAESLELVAEVMENPKAQPTETEAAPPPKKAKPKVTLEQVRTVLAEKSKVSTTIRTTETVEEYRKLKKGQQDNIKDVGGFVGGHLKGGRRKNGNVLCRSILTLDMDYGTPDIWEQMKMLFDYKCCVYSTHKHTPEKPRLRLIIPLSRDISEEEYPAVARMVAKDIGIDLFDDTTYEPCRLMYWASG